MSCLNIFKLLVLFCLSGIQNVFAQNITVSGAVKDKDSGKRIPFVNIGFMGTRTGTVSDSAGNFKLIIPGKHKEDSVSIFAVGYKNYKLSIPQLQNLKSSAIELEKKVYELKEVSVQAENKKWEEIKLGFQKGKSNLSVSHYNIFLSTYFEKSNVSKPCFIKSVRFYGKNWKDNPKLRIRIQKKDSIYNIPGEDITTESIIVSPWVKEGWVEFDISKYNVFVENGGFFVTFELLEFVPNITEYDGISIYHGYSVGMKKLKAKQQYSLHKSSYFSNWEEWKSSLMVGVTILE